MAISNRFLQSKNSAPVFARRILPLIVASVGFSQAHAVEFNIGEIEGRVDSQISIGASFRNSSRNNRLVSTGNGGVGAGTGNFDDATQNFDNGDPFSTILKGLHEADFRYGDYGFFTRAKYWYDYELEEGSRAHGNLVNQFEPGAELDDSGFNDFAKFSGFEILDAYVYGGFEVGNALVDARLGRQVVNWGESTFIQGGLNSINPVDVNAFRRPGAEIKEGLLPINVAFASVAFNDSLSLEGFYQFEWEPTAIDGCGTYFSTTDFAAQGCDGIRINPSPDPLVSGPLSVLGGLSDQTFFGSPAAFGGVDLAVRRDENGRRGADDSDQFGVALRYFSEELNNTEFGFYAAQYHSRFPIVSAVLDFGNPVFSPLNSRYFIEYPEDIGIFGVSFSTNLGNVAWSGEISHRTDVPLQVNGSSLLQAVLSNGSASNTGANNLVLRQPAGTEIRGFETFDVTQLQTTFISFQDQVLGASRLTLIGELGWTHVHDLDESAEALKFGRNGTFGFSATGGAVNQNDGFVTKDSVGYVVRANLQYPDAIAGFSLRPQISFRHGVHGFGPQPGPAFNEGERVLGLSLQAEYQNRFVVELAYTDFFGGSFNALSDRDFISLSATLSY